MSGKYYHHSRIIKHFLASSPTPEEPRTFSEMTETRLHRQRHPCAAIFTFTAHRCE
eukprot:m.1672962 g.1672962  ORF g.1672962 m.1672962 type:complete len:56 (+) comp175193_c0_seq1:25-192(+)